MLTKERLKLRDCYFPCVTTQVSPPPRPPCLPSNGSAYCMVYDCNTAAIVYQNDVRLSLWCVLVWPSHGLRRTLSHTKATDAIGRNGGT